MAKKNPFAPPKVSLGQANRQDRMADYKFTNGQIASIFGNLRTAGKGSVAGLTAQQERITGAMSRLQERTAAKEKAIVSGGASAARRLFGTGISGVTSEQFGVARATKKASAVADTAAVDAGGLQAKAGLTALQAERAGAREAQAGAQYATASALRYRAQQDAALQAQQNSAFQTWKKEQQYLARQAGASASVLASNAGPDAYAVDQAWTNGIGDMSAADFKALSPTDQVKLIAQKEGITDDNEVKYLLAVIRGGIHNGYDPLAAAQEAGSYFGIKPEHMDSYVTATQQGYTSSLTSSVQSQLNSLYGEGQLSAGDVRSAVGNLKGLGYSNDQILALIGSRAENLGLRAADLLPGGWAYAPAIRGTGSTSTSSPTIGPGRVPTYG
jgi:hypothetical protein